MSKLKQLATIFFYIATSLNVGFAEDTPTILKSYVFDDPLPIVMLPDVIATLEDGRGGVRLSRELKFSGEYAVELHSQVNDAMPAQLNGNFAVQKSGVLFLHFALMPTATNQPLTISLGNIVLTNDASNPQEAAFYLQVDQERAKLLQLHPFLWYLIDVVYDFDRSTVDVIIRDENSLQPIQKLRKSLPTKSATAVQSLYFKAGTETQGDIIESDFFVDDVVLTKNPQILQIFQASAKRRKKFMEILRDTNIATLQTHCMTPAQLDEIGIPTRTLLMNKNSQPDSIDLIRLLLAGKPLSARQQKVVAATAELAAIPSWLAACRSGIAKAPQQALELFDRALKLVPQSKLYRMSKALALAELHQWDAIDATLSPIQEDWFVDPRHMILMAMIGKIRAGQMEPKRLHYEASQFVQRQTVFEFKTASEVAYRFLSDQYLYYKLALEPENINKVRSYVEMVAIHHNGYHSYQALWLERFADVWLIKSDLKMALFIYELAYKKWPERVSLHMKLADLFFMTHDLKNEQNIRRLIVERINNQAHRL